MSAFSIIRDQCTNVSEFGRGGQKIVYKATHPVYGEVVIKEGKYSSDSTLERITREVDLLKSLDSEYYPKNYEFLVDPKTQEFVILEEFLDAQQLTEVKPLFRDELTLVKLLKQLIEALEIVWNQRIVHRDLKPANILIASDLKPKVIDFGIARFLDESSLTQTIALMGPATPMYASPEQLTNRKNLIDHRSDFFALGIIIAELHLGFHPFNPSNVGGGRGIIENLVRGNYIKPSETTGASSAFTGLISQLLQVQPYKRFRTVGILCEYIHTNWSQI